MKPFNLEKCIAGEKVVTRDGREFKFGAYNKDAHEYHRLVGWVNGECFEFSDFGEYTQNNSVSQLTLFMAEPVLYYGIIKSKCSHTGFSTSAIYYSEAELRYSIGNVKIIEIKTFEPK